MSDQGAIGLVHRHPQLLAVHIVALCEVEGHHPAGVSGDDRVLGAGQQIECEARVGVHVAAPDGKPQFVQFEDHPAFVGLGNPERLHRGGVGVGGPRSGEPA